MQQEERVAGRWSGCWLADGFSVGETAREAATESDAGDLDGDVHERGAGEGEKEGEGDDVEPVQVDVAGEGGLDGVDSEDVDEVERVAAPADEDEDGVFKEGNG